MEAYNHDGAHETVGRALVRPIIVEAGLGRVAYRPHDARGRVGHSMLAPPDNLGVDELRDRLGGKRDGNREQGLVFYLIFSPISMFCSIFNALVRCDITHVGTITRTCDFYFHL